MDFRDVLFGRGGDHGVGGTGDQGERCGCGGFGGVVGREHWGCGLGDWYFGPRNPNSHRFFVF